VPTLDGVVPTDLEGVSTSAVARWCSLHPSLAPPEGAEVLRHTKRAAAVRLRAAAHDGGTVVALRRPRREADAERIAHELVLPALDLPVLSYFGCARDGEFAWVFVEDAGGEAYRPEEPRHRALVAHWLAELHGAGQRADLAAVLPLRDVAYYREQLDEAREAVRSIVPTVTRAARRFLPVLDAIELRLAAVAAAWPDVERLCRRAPRTVHHGDISGENIRLRHTEDGVDVIAMDWERIGFGLPVIDLSHFMERPVDLQLYREAARPLWDAVDPGDLERLAVVGRVLRLFLGVGQAARRLAPGWVAKPLDDLRIQAVWLERALRLPPFGVGAR
jgi:thiamine kinase-like enzyme